VGEEVGQAEDLWSGRLGFLLAAIGSAIGLGAVWRFPYLAYEYGGGAFLIPFLIALFVSGIPLMILELGVGKTFRTSAPFAFMRINKKMAWVGWATLMIGFVIISYYTVVLAWSLVYMFAAPKLSWGSDPQGYFNNNIVHLSSGPGAFGGIGIGVLVMVIVTWLMIYYIIVRGISMVSKVVMLTVPAPYILMAILAFFSLRLHGADVGLEYYLYPDFHALLNPEVWLAAFAQIFFALSLSTGVMIAYSSRLERKADVVNNAYIVSFLDVGYAFFAGIVVFSTLGYMASHQGLPMAQVVTGGPGLAFATYPTAISMLPSGRATFGVLFFLMLFTLGIDSAFASVEAVVLGLKDAGLNYKRMSLVCCVVGGGLAALFATGGGYPGSG
jgi:NSS family neurotransmitter:Na+ symporter